MINDTQNSSRCVAVMKTQLLEDTLHSDWHPYDEAHVCILMAHPHLYANANKACGTEANAKECQKVACSAFTAQANEQAFHWSFVGCPNECISTSVWLWTYFSLKYRLQMDGIRLLPNIHRISEWRWMLFAYTSTLCILCAFSHSFRICVQM